MKKLSFINAVNTLSRNELRSISGGSGGSGPCSTTILGHSYTGLNRSTLDYLCHSYACSNSSCR